MAKNKTPRRRLFTNEFYIGDEVAIIRERHGWWDGTLTGTIVRLSANCCWVMADGVEREIWHPRDIVLVRGRKR